MRAYLEERNCLEAITDPRPKDLATFTAENPTDDSVKEGVTDVSRGTTAPVETGVRR